jgi:hypothetical protein
MPAKTTWAASPPPRVATACRCYVTTDGGEVRKRKKKPSKKFREQYGHTPLSAEEEIPWKCKRLVVGTGAYGR